jgi:hypothetical protein
VSATVNARKTEARWSFNIGSNEAPNSFSLAFFFLNNFDYQLFRRIGIIASGTNDFITSHSSMRLRFCPSGNSTEHLFFNIFDVGEPTQTSHIAVFCGRLSLYKEFFHQLRLVAVFFPTKCCLQMPWFVSTGPSMRKEPRNRLIQGEWVQGIADASSITAKSFPLGRPAQLRFRASECDRATTARLSLKSHAPGSPIKSDPR